MFDQEKKKNTFRESWREPSEELLSLWGAFIALKQASNTAQVRYWSLK